MRCLRKTCQLLGLIRGSSKLLNFLHPLFLLFKNVCCITSDTVRYGWVGHTCMNPCVFAPRWWKSRLFEILTKLLQAWLFRLSRIFTRVILWRLKNSSWRNFPFTISHQTIALFRLHSMDLFLRKVIILLRWLATECHSKLTWLYCLNSSNICTNRYLWYSLICDAAAFNIFALVFQGRVIILLNSNFFILILVLLAILVIVELLVCGWSLMSYLMG